MKLNKKEIYFKTIKHNLRTFLVAKGYKVTADSEDDFCEKVAEIRLKPLSNLINKLEEKAQYYTKESKYSNMKEKLSKVLYTDYDIETDAKNHKTKEKNHIDVYFINEICELCKFPLEKIYSYNKITYEQAKKIVDDISKWNITIQNKFEPLSKNTHRCYFGDFYGYTFEHNPNEKDCIKKFQLSIFEDDSGSPKAVYKHHNSSNNELSVFSGIPYYASEQKAICIEMLTDDKQKYQYIYFNGKPYSSTKLTYKSGACIRTSSASRNDEPDVKNFIITGFELPDNTLNEIVPGLLKMSSDNFYITSAQLEKLETENSELKVFHKKHDEDFHLIDNSVFSVKELKIIRSTELESNDKRIYTFECLTKIKAHALSSNRVIYRNTEADYTYFKYLSKN